MRIIVTFLRPLSYFAVRSGRFTHDAYLLTHEVKGSAIGAVPWSAAQPLDRVAYYKDVE